MAEKKEERAVIQAAVRHIKSKLQALQVSYQGYLDELPAQHVGDLSSKLQAASTAIQTLLNAGARLAWGERDFTLHIRGELISAAGTLERYCFHLHYYESGEMPPMVQKPASEVKERTRRAGEKIEALEAIVVLETLLPLLEAIPDESRCYREMSDAYRTLRMISELETADQP